MSARDGAGDGAAREGERVDAIVVGAGPAGSSAARHLARAGLDVLLLEKGGFPRDKVCGDGLTPRAVRELAALGVPTDGEGWQRTRGLRLVGGGRAHEIPWPELSSFPSYGLVRSRSDFDALLARHAVAGGARLLERTAASAPVLDDATGRVVGVRARAVDDAGRRAGPDVVHRAPVVLAADGVSARLATALGIARRTDRPLGTGVRAYFATPRSGDPWMESWLELWDGEPRRSRLLPGYGWIFGLGNGTANAGLGVVDTSRGPGPGGLRALLRAWLATLPPQWQLDEAHQVGEVRSAALPMGFNRTPHASRGMLLLGDAGGMVNPFNGEGIEYAMHSGRLAAEVTAAALRAPGADARERALQAYPQALRAELGGYFTLGRAFARLISQPPVMAAAVRYGLPRPVVMRVVVKLLANLAEPVGGDAADRLVTALSRLAPAR
ncbi:geranylgeranyl reductase family protein [Quadrisphaera sp. DSM 44207]|uniref:geranylgeranyl reductase family protein n=1 Tax=Quadrisphaera sp. DSM 44207 TaxID=1881057 RepID=UPI00087FB82F|nr:geranylgeranyl reductase family protein [Quadrisphaera sp. DSM 44207]SDQ15183.1 geranylgeranyl reductase family [Quadrisphaera sp. DSM 44207]